VKTYGGRPRRAPNEQKCHAERRDEEDYVLEGALYAYPALFVGSLEMPRCGWRRVLGGEDRGAAQKEGNPLHTAFQRC